MPDEGGHAPGVVFRNRQLRSMVDGITGRNMAAAEVDAQRGAPQSFADAASNGLKKRDSNLELDWSKSILIKGEVSGPNVIRFVKKSLGGEGLLAGCRLIRPFLYELLFTDKKTADNFFNLGPALEIDGICAEQRRAGERTKTIYVHGLPFPVSDRVLAHYLRDYGEIKAIIREKWREPDCQNEETGVRIVQMIPKVDPPNFIRMGQFMARLSYPGMTRLCAKCFGEGHLASECSIKKCYNCGSERHLAGGCPEKCRNCKETGHNYIECQRQTFKELVDVSIGNAAVEEIPLDDKELQNQAAQLLASQDLSSSDDNESEATDDDEPLILNEEDLMEAINRDPKSTTKICENFLLLHPVKSDAKKILRKVRETLEKKTGNKVSKRKKENLSPEERKLRSGKRAAPKSDPWNETLSSIKRLDAHMAKFYKERQMAEINIGSPPPYRLANGSEVRAITVSETSDVIFVTREEMEIITNVDSVSSDSQKTLEDLKRLGVTNMPSAK